MSWGAACQGHAGVTAFLQCSCFTLTQTHETSDAPFQFRMGSPLGMMCMAWTAFTACVLLGCLLHGTIAIHRPSTDPNAHTLVATADTH